MWMGIDTHWVTDLKNSASQEMESLCLEFIFVSNYLVKPTDCLWLPMNTIISIAYDGGNFDAVWA